MAMLSKLQETFLGILWVFSLLLRNLSIQISMILFSGILVNKKSTSTLDIYKLASCLQFLQLNEVSL